MNKQQAAQEALKRRQSKGRFKLPEGDTTFRVLPNARGTQYPDFVEYMKHYQVGPKHRIVRCGKNTRGEGNCWICDVAISKLAGSSKTALQNLSKTLAFQTKEVLAVQILYKDTTGVWRGPVLFEAPGTVAQALLSFFGRGNRQYTDPNRGYNFTVTRKGTDKKTRYDALEPDDKPSKLPSSVISKIKPFGELVEKYDENKAKNAFYGKDDEDEDAVAPALEEEETVAAEEEAALEEETVEEVTEELEAEGEEAIEEPEEEAVEEEPPARPSKTRKPGAQTKPSVKKKSAAEPDIDFNESVEEEVEEQTEELEGTEEPAEELEEAVEEESSEEPEVPIDDEFNFEEEPAPSKKPAAGKKPAPQSSKKPVAGKKAVKK